MDAFIGEIRLFPFSFAPQGWYACNGQTLAISSNSTLFSLIGTSFGGNGTTNFNLPQLQNYSAVGAGAGPGLTNYVVGEVSGMAAVNLITSQIPTHMHVVQAGSQPQGLPAPSASVLFGSGVVNNGGVLTKLYATSTDGTKMAPNTIGPPAVATGSAHDNHQPYLALQYCICWQGQYPARP